MLSSLITNAFQALPRVIARPVGTIINAPAITNPWSLTFNRTVVRQHFPHPNERKRIKRHGWHARMATLSGRKILMRRILKGKHILTH